MLQPIFLNSKNSTIQILLVKTDQQIDSLSDIRSVQCGVIRDENALFSFSKTYFYEA